MVEMLETARRCAGRGGASIGGRSSGNGALNGGAAGAIGADVPGRDKRDCEENDCVEDKSGVLRGEPPGEALDLLNSDDRLPRGADEGVLVRAGVSGAFERNELLRNSLELLLLESGDTERMPRKDSSCTVPVGESSVCDVFRGVLDHGNMEGFPSSSPRSKCSSPESPALIGCAELSIAESTSNHVGNPRGCVFKEVYLIHTCSRKVRALSMGVYYIDYKPRVDSRSIAIFLFSSLTVKSSDSAICTCRSR